MRVQGIGSRELIRSGRTIHHDVRKLEDLCSCHTSLVLRQLVQPLQSVFHLLLSNQLLHNFF